MGISLKNHEDRITKLEQSGAGATGVLWSKGQFEPATDGGPYTPTSAPVVVANLTNVQKTATFLYISWKLWAGGTQTKLVPVFTFTGKDLILETVNYNSAGGKTDRMGVRLDGNQLKVIHHWMKVRGVIYFMYLIK